MDQFANLRKLGIKIFSGLPCKLTILKNEKPQFKPALRRYLNGHFICSVVQK
jgi:hypothetical protein